MVGTSNLSVPDMAIDIMEDSWDNCGIFILVWDVSWDTSWLKKIDITVSIDYGLSSPIVTLVVRSDHGSLTPDP